ncbi:hypothetical protein BRD56_08210 [Thermoplasmatales archaeon SW_10_69_26]|nr:MAG: hypothetical protein BRD56_08210 [Thermoplasmatales archaeon SW_10_69_26]
MPFGVSQDFLNRLDEGQRRGLLALIPLTLAGLTGGFVAEMLDPGRVGAFVWSYAGSLVAGLAIGGLVGWRVVQTWGQSLRESWTDWMHSAIGAPDIGETAQRAGARHVTIGRATGAGLVAANAAVLIAAWFQLPAFALLDVYGAFAILTVAATGLAIGARAAIGLAEAWWCREIEDQTMDLVREGRVGVWGMR